jgi:TonB family protein
MMPLLIGITVLLTAAWGATAVLRNQSAALRHAIWACAIAAALLLAPLRWSAPQHVVTQTLPVVLTPTLTVAAGRAENPLSFAWIAAAVWAVGAALVAFPLLTSWIELRRIIQSAREVRSSWPVPILTSPRVSGPLVSGFLIPVIVLPEEASSWTASRRRAVLAHEIAHVRRRDPLTLAMAHLATIVYWFHPLCWLAASRLRAESESACDDAALRIGLLPSDYAGHLLDLARAFNPQPAIPMASTSHLESRVKSILNPFVKRSSAARRNWLAATLVTAAVMAPLTVFSLRAQQTAGSGTIVGTVSDPTGAVLRYAQIIATNPDAHNTEVTTSDFDGTFAFRNIPAGHYSLEVRMGGFAAAHMNNLDLVSGGTLQADAHLAVGALNERVQVVAQGTHLAQTTPTAGPIRVGGMVQGARLLQQIKPIYPADLQAQGIEGTVLLSALISKDGTPSSISPQNTAVKAEFVYAAVEAVRQWRYQPTLLNGEPIDVLTTITVDFRLEQ